MRIFDLFYRLINDEEMPKKIKTISDNEEYVFDEFCSDYTNDDVYLFETICDFMDTKTFLSEEIEIIKE